MSNGDIEEWLANRPPGSWIELLQEGVAEYALETGGSETAVDSFMEWLAEWGREVRRRQRGLLLLTAHRAKGLELTTSSYWTAAGTGWGRRGFRLAAAPVLRGDDPSEADAGTDALTGQASVPGCFAEHFLGIAPA